LASQLLLRLVLKKNTKRGENKLNSGFSGGIPEYRIAEDQPVTK
jgi:hypothetical protein